jgi:hypothetical protein
MRRYSCALAFGLSCVLLIGCGAPVHHDGQAVDASTPVVPTLAAVEQAAQPTAAAAADPTAGQKIIYRAMLDFQVADFAVASTRIRKLVQSTGGFVAQFREERPSGALRGGHWTLRIPVPQFDHFIEEARQLGVCDRREINSTSVTEEFVDLEARLKNKQQLELRLLELVAKQTGDIKDVLTVETELGRVREEIERMQGRLRMLSDRVALTTVEISAYERHEYHPPEATFAGRIHDTWQHSLDRMRQLGETCFLAVVALAPWLALLTMLAFVFVTPCAWLIRRWLRRLSGPARHAQVV